MHIFSPPSQFSRLGTQVTYSFCVCVLVLFGLGVWVFFSSFMTGLGSVCIHVHVQCVHVCVFPADETYSNKLETGNTHLCVPLFACTCVHLLLMHTFSYVCMKYLHVYVYQIMKPQSTTDTVGQATCGTAHHHALLVLKCQTTVVLP